MAQKGPSYLHAGTNSETGLLATNKYQADVLRFPLVFIFPSDGTFWSTNPICILDTDWVTEEQGEAAKLYAEYLQEPEAQETAVEIGLRPASDIELHAPIALENGTDPRVSPETIPPLESVSGDTATAIKDVFKMTKRRATVVILLDTSLSMRGNKMKNAVDGTINFIKRLERDDEVIAYTFNDNTAELEPSGRVGNVTESLRRILSGLFAEGNTALYDSVCTAVERLSQEREEDQEFGIKRNYGIVLLSDGEDTNSRKSESDMFMCLPSGEDVEGIKVFTIAYGDEADEDLLLRIANRTNGKAYSGDPTTIEEVYLAISFEQ
jgi:Ca-activated chloride channel family protein